MPDPNQPKDQPDPQKDYCQCERTPGKVFWVDSHESMIHDDCGLEIPEVSFHAPSPSTQKDKAVECITINSCRHAQSLGVCEKCFNSAVSKAVREAVEGFRERAAKTCEELREEVFPCEDWKSPKECADAVRRLPTEPGK